MHELEQTIARWVAEYGYGAVPFALLTDPAGVPWAWIFLMLLAEESGKNIALMLFLGFASLMAWDHALYWLGVSGGRRLLLKIGARFPKLGASFEAAQNEVLKRGAIAVIGGRYLPVVGRWVGLGAGMAGVKYPIFTLYTAIGAGLSVFGFGLIAHFVGRKTIEHPLFHEILMVVFVGGTVVTLAGLAFAAWRRKVGEKVSE